VEGVDERENGTAGDGDADLTVDEVLWLLEFGWQQGD
jgi:hypothetical protein